MNREPQIQVFRIAHSDGSYIEVSNLGARWLSWVVSNGNGSCVEKGSIIESKKERGRQIKAAGQSP